MYVLESLWKLPPPPVSHFRHSSDIRRSSAILEWELPDTEVDHVTRSYPPIRSWILHRHDDVRRSWRRLATLPPTTTRYDVTGLRDDVTHKFRLFSETHEGLSRPLEYELPAYVISRRADVPDRPSGPMVLTKLSSHSMQLEWRPPMSDGGDVIRGYVIEMSQGIGNWRKVGYTTKHETSYTVAGMFFNIPLYFCNQ